jgi:hypothetical protein
MTDTPMQAWAAAVLVQAGEICFTPEAVEALDYMDARLSAGEKLTNAEIETIEAALRECPGFTEAQSRDLLARTLLGEKAFA